MGVPGRTAAAGPVSRAAAEAAARPTEQARPTQPTQPTEQARQARQARQTQATRQPRAESARASRHNATRARRPSMAPGGSAPDRVARNSTWTSSRFQSQNVITVTRRWRTGRATGSAISSRSGTANAPGRLAAATHGVVTSSTPSRGSRAAVPARATPEPAAVTTIGRNRQPAGDSTRARPDIWRGPRRRGGSTPAGRRATRS